MTLFVLHSGLLSGKYKRDTTPSEGRIGWVAQDEQARANQVCPGWGRVSTQDRIWNTLDIMKNCANKHGENSNGILIRPYFDIVMHFVIVVLAVVAHACHGHTLQLSTGLSVDDRRLVISSNPVRG